MTILFFRTGQIKVHQCRVNNFVILGDSNHRAATYYLSKKNVRLLNNEQHILERLLRPRPVILDIGAHIGVRSLLFSSIPNSQVWAFEPVRDNYDLLVKNIETNRAANIRPFRLGMSDRCRTAFFGSPTRKQGWRYSLDDPPDHALKSLYAEKVMRGREIVNGEYAPVDTIDSFVAQHGIEKVDCIKIDTEGDDLHVVKGGLGTIKKHLPLIELEVIDYILQLAGLTVEDVIGYLQGLDSYKIYYLTEDMKDILEVQGNRHPSVMDLILIPAREPDLHAGSTGPFRPVSPSDP